MGLKEDLINAKIESLKLLTNSSTIEMTDSIEIEAELTKEAIVKFLENAEFRITEFAAPVIIEDFKIPEQIVSVEPDTLYQPQKPLIDILSKVATAIGQEKLVRIVDDVIKKTIGNISEEGARLPELDLNKDGKTSSSNTKNKGVVESTGYTYVGQDPDSVKLFNVEDEDGQRTHTTVKFFREDNEDLL